VTQWTEKKGIDIFEKRFVFIPVNKGLHWTQCVVINPGAITEHNKWRLRGFDHEEFDPNTPFPCILFLDALQSHQKNQVTKNIKDWLNAEWKRLGKSEDPSPFTSHRKSMSIFTPKSKYSY
jgi:Ulp1 family protease